MTQATTAIHAEQVSVTHAREVLLAPVSFTVEFGTTLAVTGANGSGKTTLLRVLAGLARAHRGMVRIDGARPDERSPTFRRRVAALLSPPPMARNLTLHEHLTMVGASWGLALEPAREQARSLLAEFGITRLRERFPHELSSGQSQLFALAITFARPYRLLLLDEPEQRLDQDRVGQLAAALRRRSAPETATVLVTHSQRLVEEIADRSLRLVEPVQESSMPAPTHRSAHP